MGLIAHIDTCASVLAVIVLGIQIKVSWYRMTKEKALSKKANGFKK